MDSPPMLHNPGCVINLNLSNQKCDLADLKKYKNLIELDLSGSEFGNSIHETRTLFELRYLRKLIMAYNGLEEVWELPGGLETLILNNNKITKISINLLQLTNLITLDLSNNLIRDIRPLANLMKLKFLFLKNNQISTFGFLSHLPSLLELDLEGNSVSETEDLSKFASNDTIKIIYLKNTPLSELKLIEQIPLPNFNFIKDGIVCRNAKVLKTSYIYANISDQSNPNRSAFINKSVISAKKQESDQESSDENGEIGENEDISADMQLDSNKVIGSDCFRSSYSDEAGNPNSKKSNPNLHSLSTFSSRFSSVNKDGEKPSQSSARQLEYPRTPILESTKEHPESKKPFMKLDLSAVLNNKQTGSAYQAQTVPNTATNSMMNSLNNSQAKVSPILPDQLKEKQAAKAKQNLPRLNLSVFADNSTLSNLAGASIKTSTNTYTINSGQGQSDNVGLNTSNRAQIEQYMTALSEENENLKKEIDNVVKENLELHKKLESIELSMQDSSESKIEIEQLKNINRKLCAKITVLEKKTQNSKKDSLEEKLQVRELIIALENCVRGYVESTLTHSSYSGFQLIEMIADKFKKLQAGAKPEFNQKILEQFDHLRDHYRKKQEKLQMIISDLESQITFKYADKVNKLQKLLKISQIDVENLMKKYLNLKKRHAECTKHELTKNPRKECQTEKHDQQLQMKDDYTSAVAENTQLREALAKAKQDLCIISNNYENLVVQSAHETQGLQAKITKLKKQQKLASKSIASRTNSSTLLTQESHQPKPSDGKKKRNKSMNMGTGQQRPFFLIDKVSSSLTQILSKKRNLPKETVTAQLDRFLIPPDQEDNSHIFTESSNSENKSTLKKATGVIMDTKQFK